MTSLTPPTCFEVNGEAVSVNQADYRCWSLLAAGPKEKRMCCPVHSGNEVSCGAGGVVVYPC